MKKLFVLLLALTLCFALIACGGDTPCTEHTDADGNGKCDTCDATVEPAGGDVGGGTQNADSLELVKGDSATFQVIYTSETADTVGKPLTNFVKTLNDCIKSGNVTAGPDTTEEKTVEIIIGAVATRGDAIASVNPYAYGYEGWSVQIIGNKIVVLGGSAGAYKDALAYVEETIFGIDDATISVNNVVMTKDQAKTEEQTKFDVTVTVGEAPLTEYVFAVNADDTYATEAIESIRNQLFKRTGAYLKTVKISDLAAGQKAVYIETVELNGEKTTKEGARIYVEDGNLHIETEFPNKLQEVAYNYLITSVAESKKSSVTISASLNNKIDVRNIYYKDFGAKGDSVTDDFYAIKACHDYANEWGHTANADGPTKTYYIGNYLGKSTSMLSIEVQTDTNWHGCTFIWDDSGVEVGSGCYKSPIFAIVPSKDAYSVPSSQRPTGLLEKGSLDLGGWAPGIECLVYIENSDERHYIRYGLNENNGSSQHEILHVYADGTLDPMTPLQWDYERVTYLAVYPIDEKPITVTGGDGDERVTVKTIFNGARSLYNYYMRNFHITRSNVTLQNIDHIVEGEKPESKGGTGAPYTGFTYVTYAHNVTIQNMLIHNLEGYHLENNPSNGMGTYEMNATCANNVWYKNVIQDVFFNADGSISYEGLMGTNYCKNLGFDGNFICSFDAHCGVYNGTILNSTVEHLNFIGDGLITIENTTLYMDGSRTAVQLRSDYGATWRGDLYMKNVDLKYQVSRKEGNNWKYSIVSAGWENHYFGYTCYLPQDIYLEDVNFLGFDVEVVNGVRNETIRRTNEEEIYLFTSSIYAYINEDLSDPNQVISSKTNDWRQCTCAKGFNDTDGDGRCNNTVKGQSDQNVWCWGFKDKPDTTVNANPYIGTKTVTVVNSNPDKPLKVVWPLTPQFKDMDVTIDGVLVIEDGVELKKN